MVQARELPRRLSQHPGDLSATSTPRSLKDRHSTSRQRLHPSSHPSYPHRIHPRHLSTSLYFSPFCLALARRQPSHSIHIPSPTLWVGLVGVERGDRGRELLPRRVNTSVQYFLQTLPAQARWTSRHRKSDACPRKILLATLQAM